MKERGLNLPSLDDILFTSEEERQDAALEKVQILSLSDLHPFTSHPFQVRDDEEMDRMVDSVKEYGVMTPAIVRPRREGGYEIVAGHRRCHASQRAGLDTMPCLVRDMDDDTAIILMVDSNCQREHILPSEKAKAYEMKLEAVKRKAGRPSKMNSGQLGPNFEERRSNQIVANDAGESVKQVQRYIRLNNLIRPTGEIQTVTMKDKRIEPPPQEHPDTPDTPAPTPAPTPMPTPARTPTIPQTGDSFPVVLLVILLLASAAALVTVALYGRRNRLPKPIDKSKSK